MIKVLTYTRLIILGAVGPSESSAEAEIGELDVTVFVDQNVVGFDIAVDETQLVNALPGRKGNFI